ncbi:MAG TPA: metallophosphoesterase family protein [Trueperaceae bacterium]|nr:metallophosphoesterase family protein [Trueperaceae bacterium]
MIAVIADVHGNLAALEAVIADMLRFDVEEVLCLGDVANFGPEPSATIARLRSLDPLTVMGNTDAYLLTPRTRADVAQPDEHTATILAVEAWCAERLSDEDREWLRTFPPYRELELGGCRVLAYHGSPRSYDDHVTPETPQARLDEYFAGHDAELYLGAHVHHQFARRHRSAVVANPGSVGMAYDRPPGGGERVAVAEYALLQVVDGEPNLHLRRVPYDVELLREATARSGMPHGELYLGALAG